MAIKKNSQTNQEAMLKIRGAREHNLKNIDLDLPRDKLIVITGVSGSGKSSLAFDTIFAEGQRRYVESLSAYARQFLGKVDKPKVDSIEGLSPAISIEQKTAHKNPRSTVGTITEIYDYIRLLYARIGKPHCPNCKRKVTSVTVDQIVAKILALPDALKLQILAPIKENQKGEFRSLLEKLRREGYRRIRLDGQLHLLEDNIKINRKKKHTLEVIIDRFTLKMKSERKTQASRLAQSIETALKIGEGNLLLTTDDATKSKNDLFFSQKLYCKHCDHYLPELTPQSFSFNSPKGACPECDGLGVILEYAEEKIVHDPSLSLMQGALSYWSPTRIEYFIDIIQLLAKELKFNPHDPWKSLPRKTQKAIIYGDESIDFIGIIPRLKQRAEHYAKTGDMPWFAKYLHENPCPLCKGARLRADSLAVYLENTANKTINISDICALTIEDEFQWFSHLKLNQQEKFIADPIIREILSRLSFLQHVGVEYLSLSRVSGSLSGGEAQRIRLATQIGSALMGVLYVLDEPSIGLHQRDNARLLSALKSMRDLGNTLIIVEHDEETIRKADHIVDIGVYAGKYGGEIIAHGPLAEILKCKKSLTGQYLSGKQFIPIPKSYRRGLGKNIIIRNAKTNNLKNISVPIPLGKLICVTGVSGSGKSTLINEVLLKRMKYHTTAKKIENYHLIDSIIAITQEPIGKTPRSNPATYTGLFTPIRELFAKLPEAVIRGYLPGRFSFNVNGGRCEKCLGAGQLKIEMHFLPDVFVSCDACRGFRYKQETLEVKYKGKSIYDVLKMTVDEALLFFKHIPAIYYKLITLEKVGLNYIQLGQPATTLSGGEAQRIKLAAELSRRSRGHILYILDEPTTGLHFSDIKRLLEVLHELVDRNNTMIIIEHNLDVIKTADIIIDLGPEGGLKGGNIIAMGTPKEIIKHKHSYTGQYLKPIFEKTQSLMHT